MLADPNQPYNLCGFSYYELIALRCDLFEAGILNKWSSPYKDKARIYLRRCLGLPDKWEGEDDTKDNN